jgi:hypothetical protein
MERVSVLRALWGRRWRVRGGSRATVYTGGICVAGVALAVGAGGHDIAPKLVYSTYCILIYTLIYWLQKFETHQGG